MRRFFFFAFFFVLFAATIPLRANINAAVNDFYNMNFQKSWDVLDSLKNNASLSKTDSIEIFQYLGMNAAKLGQDSLAVDHFYQLLLLDSLWQFPENEDESILKDFKVAKESYEEEQDIKPEPLKLTAAEVASHPLKIEISPSKNAIKMINLGDGLIPLGLGWVAKKRFKSGIAYGLLEGGGALLSIFASMRQDQIDKDKYGIMNQSELNKSQQWQFTQRLSFSVALGAYLISVLATLGE